MSLVTPIARLPRMQPKFAKKFNELGLITLRDALFYFPFRHEDWRARVNIADLVVGQDVTITATIVSIKSRRAWRRRGTTVTEALVTDESGGKLHVTWFNIPFLAKSLKPGESVFLSGTISQSKTGRRQMNNPTYERPSDHPLHEKLVPVYRTTDGLSQRQIRLVMKEAATMAGLIPDPLEPAIVRDLGFVGLPEALAAIHFPAGPTEAHQAVERLKFDELLAWHLRLSRETSDPNARLAPIIPFHETAIRSFVQHLPFTLTNDQRIAAWQILQDMVKPQPMSRLVQGDVGSGKTVVAALVAYNVALSHHQVALVAPTLVLAEQHWQTFTTMLDQHDTKIGLLTGHDAKIFSSGTATTVSRPELLAALAEGTIAIIIGTHAVLQPEVIFHQLGLVIVDEQQRFGVDQRQTLIAGRSEVPHFLSLTATPIPRSFALWLSGILSISTIATKPPGRLPISSFVIGPTQRRPVDQAIATTLERDEQVYIITPLIEESDSLGVRAATTEFERVRRARPHARVGILHGVMPAADRVAVLDQFRRHELDILVSTTVIEVGVDVPNATLMIIEGAERFGLAQLHQLRGRVGRSSVPSTCYFVTDKESPEIQQRLQKVASTTDGFAIAEIDLTERGAGDLYGQRQSGLPTWQLATLNDRELFDRVRKFVVTLDPDQRSKLEQRLTDDEPASAAFHPE